MSKIENVLAKARALGQLPVKMTATGPGSQLVPALTDRSERARDNNSSQHAAATKEIVRMKEPKLLDAAALAQQRIICLQMDGKEVANAFRELRTKILQKTARNCTVVVSACGEDNGNSFVALNLAVAFSLDENKTALLVDCNLRSPSCEGLVGGEGGFGVSDFIKNDQLSVEEIIHPTGIRRLRLVPAGKSHNLVAEFFTSDRFRVLVKGLRERYSDRYIIIDAPPVLKSADARTLAEIADYVVLVVPYGKVTETQVSAAAKTVGSSKLLGVVFDDVPSLPSGDMPWQKWVKWLAGRSWLRKGVRELAKEK